MDISFLNAIHIDRYAVRLKLTRATSLPFFHGHIMYSLLCNALQKHPLGMEYLVHPVESGRVLFNAGEYYNFGITLLKEDTSFGQTLYNALQRISPENSGDETKRFFYEVVEVKKLPSPDLRLIKKKEEKNLTVRFLTPLRMLQGGGVKNKFLETSNFDFRRFLFLLYNRLYDLSKLSGKEIPPYMKPEIPECVITRANLMWVDVPAKAKEKLGGIMGRIDVNGELAEDWLKLLFYGECLCAGNNVSLGFGKFRLDEHEDTLFPLSRSVSFLELSLRKEHLPKFAGTSVQVSGMENGNYSISAEMESPLQQSITDVISPSILKLLEENFYSFRKEISRLITPAKSKSGYGLSSANMFKVNIESFFDNVDWNILFEKLRVLFSDDPVLPIIMMWIKQPVMYNGLKITRTKGLPQGSPLSPLLANLYLDEFDEALQSGIRLVRYADDLFIDCKSQGALKSLQKTIIESLLKK